MRTGDPIESRQAVLFQHSVGLCNLPAGDISADSTILTLKCLRIFRLSSAREQTRQVESLSRILAKYFVVIVPAFCLAPHTAAEVLDAGSNGFTVRHQVSVEANRAAVYGAAVDHIGQWWSSDHTFSGDAANLRMTATVPGCFCETFGQGAGLVHMSVTFVNPGVMLRLSGGLGPLGLMGVAGNMTWEFDATETGTVVTLQYAVGGYMDGGLDTVASAVDGVLVEAMSRLKAFVETGSPTEG